MTTVIIDCETSIAIGHKGHTPSPFVGAKIIYYGCKQLGEEALIFKINGHWKNCYLPVMDSEDGLLVGHNIGFDLQHMRVSRRFPQLSKGVPSNIQVWDTQVVEYLLSGQTLRMPSLDTVCKIYGLPVKDTAVSERFAMGDGADKIPEKMMREYLEHDLVVTEQVFLKQLERTHAMGMYQLIRSQMNTLLALSEIEYNGMVISDKVHPHKIYLDTAVEACDRDTRRMAEAILGKEIAFNPASPEQLVKLLCGGSWEVESLEPMLDDAGTMMRYKTGAKKGTPKTKRVSRMVDSAPILTSAEQALLGKTITGAVSVDDDSLTKVVNIHPIIGEIQARRSYKKELSTYVLPYLSMLEYSTDKRLHPQYNQSVTRTGRISCSHPNLQNVSDKDAH